jgi:predicted NAD/FAD-binding protein
MACSWRLRDYECDVDLYESQACLGGHANSVLFKGNGTSVPVDTGFIAFDEHTYRKYSTHTPMVELSLIERG